MNATKKSQAQDIFSQYQKEHGSAPIDMRSVAKWALDKGLWAVDSSDMYSLAATDLREALRTEFHEDSQGRKVRTYHSVRKRVRQGNGFKQAYLWQSMPEAKREFMATSFQQRRRGIAGDVYQLNNDISSYNTNYNTGTMIQMDFNFNLDIEESEATGNHPDIDEGEEDIL